MTETEKEKIMGFSKEKINYILNVLKELYPDAQCALNHNSNFELLVSVMLSAQTTDVSVNLATPALFEKFPDAKAIAQADVGELEELIRKIGMYRTKAKNLKLMCTMLQEEYGGTVPNDYDQLITLPGVGRKTANVVLAVGFGEQRIAVDTHVFRVSNRIDLVSESDVLKTELALMKTIPKERWTETHHSLIFHGRNICVARKPKCPECPLAELCKYKNKTIQKDK